MITGSISDYVKETYEEIQPKKIDAKENKPLQISIKL